MAKRKQLELLPNVLRVHAHYAQETSVSAFRSPYPALLCLTSSSCRATPCRSLPAARGVHNWSAPAVVEWRQLRKAKNQSEYR